MEKESIIIQYINIWNWHILAVIFLISSFIFFLNSNFIGDILWFVALVSFLVCEVISIKRKKQLFKEENFNGNFK